MEGILSSTKMSLLACAVRCMLERLVKQLKRLMDTIPYIFLIYLHLDVKTFKVDTYYANC